MRIKLASACLLSLTALMAAACGSEDESQATGRSDESLLRCGDGKINFIGELCDRDNLNGQTCASVTFGLRPYGTLKCNKLCLFDIKGCSRKPVGPGGTGGGGTGGGTGGTGGGSGGNGG